MVEGLHIEVLARPSLELAPAARNRLFVSRRVGLADDDQSGPVAFDPWACGARRRFDVDVHAGRCVAPEAGCDSVGTAGAGLGEEPGEVDEGKECGEHHPRRTNLAVRRLNNGMVGAFDDAGGSRVLEDATSAGGDAAGQSCGIAAGVEMGLVVEPQRHLDREREVHVSGEHGRQPEADGSLVFRLDGATFVGRQRVDVGGSPLELAVGLGLVRKCGDHLDRGLVRIGV